MKLYGVGRSRASKNIWLLGEMGTDYQQVPVIQAYRVKEPQAAGAPLHTRSPEFLAVSPAGAVPVLEDGGLVLTESFAINLYLAGKAGAPLGPKDAGESALMTSWAFYTATSMEADALKVFQVHAQKRDVTDEGKAELTAALGRLERPLKVVEAKLAAEGHPVGGRFTVADINLAEVVRYLQADPAYLAPYPATAAWLAACHARPAFKAMWEARAAEPL